MYQFCAAGLVVSGFVLSLFKHAAHVLQFFCEGSGSYC